MPPGSVSFVMGDTAMTADQGGVGGSTSIMLWREAPAQRRRRPRAICSCRLASPSGSALPAEQLQIRERRHQRERATPSKNISFGDLAGGTDLNDALKVSGDRIRSQRGGHGQAEGSRPPTRWSDKPLLRVDMPRKILRHAANTSPTCACPDMLHGRVVRPAGVGAKLVRVDEDAVKGDSRLRADRRERKFRRRRRGE